jgi:hypothetical protein
MNLLYKALSILADTALVHSRVNAEEKARRLTICEEPCFYFDHKARRCKVCKCYVDAKAGAETNFNPKAARNEITHCPKGYWGDTDTANFYREKDGLQPITKI